MAKDTKENKKNKNNKTRYYSMILVAGVALTVWSVFFKGPAALENADVNIVGDEVKNTDSQVSGNYLEGRLEKSDEPSRGNLKLVSSLAEIYIRTSRDFSGFIGSDVLIYIEGTMDNFSLVNIEKRVEKDGYIKVQ